MWAKLTKTLESWGLRCSKCGGWRTHTKSVSLTLVEREWDASMRGLPRAQYFCLKKKVRTCGCGHVMCSRLISMESV